MPDDGWVDPDGDGGFFFGLLVAPSLIICGVATVIAAGHFLWSILPKNRSWWSNDEPRVMPDEGQSERVKGFVRGMAAMGAIAPALLYVIFPPLLLIAVLPLLCIRGVSTKARTTDRVPRGVIPVAVTVLPGVAAVFVYAVAVPVLAPFLLCVAAGIGILPWQLAVIRRAEIVHLSPTTAEAHHDYDS